MKLHRPYIPLDVRLQVARRQLIENGWTEKGLDNHPADQSKNATLAAYLFFLFGMFNPNPPTAIQLDHDPALTNRKYNPRTKKYTPDANDPRFLIYRTKPAHDIKTRVRGDGAQLSDLALRRKFKRIEKRKAAGKR